MEALPFAKPSQVCTDALNTLILATSMFLGNEGRVKCCRCSVSRSATIRYSGCMTRLNLSMTRMWKRLALMMSLSERGKTYATAIYDLRDHHLIALLDGRDGGALKEWLKSHNKVRLVARDRASAYASTISEVLPGCVQVADRFHLLQNLLGYMKDIFKEDMPPKIYIQDGNISEKAPEKILKEKTPEDSFLESLHYDNTPPVDSSGNVIAYDNKKHDLNSAQYQHQEKTRKKQQLIRDIQYYWNGQENPQIKKAAEAFGIISPTAKKYIFITQEDFNSLGHPANYKKGNHP